MNAPSAHYIRNLWGENIQPNSIPRVFPCHAKQIAGQTQPTQVGHESYWHDAMSLSWNGPCGLEVLL